MTSIPGSGVVVSGAGFPNELRSTACEKFGALKVTIASILILFSSLGIIVHLQSSLLFLIFNLVFGFGITAVHVCLNSQGFHFLERSKINLITSTAGYWSAGALSTAIQKRRYSVQGSPLLQENVEPTP